MTEKPLSYRGEVRSAVGSGGTLAFVTTGTEVGAAAGLYRLDLDKLSLTFETLPNGGLALVEDRGTLWASAGDGRIFEAPASGGPPAARGPGREAPASAIAPLERGRLAAMVGSRILILARKDGEALQDLELPEPGTCLAADPSGTWLAAGTSKGTVAVFEAEGKDRFLPSASGKLHEGAVSSILFEPDDLRFFSAGADLKLLSTHARGRLEPEDKGRGNNHSDLITSMAWGPGDRLYTGSRDGSIKSWPRAGAIKPSTVKDGVGRVVALALVTVLDRPRLVAACDDNSLRVFPVDPAGKIGDASQRILDAYALARTELSERDPDRREAALRTLAGFGDSRAVDLIAEQVGSDSDYTLRLLGAKLLGESSHPRAVTRLEAALGHPDEAVRVAAFRGLRRHLGEADLRPIDLALKAEKPDIGKLAIEALEALSAKDDRALSRLTGALDASTSEVRLAALLALESAHGPGSPEANLSALGSKHADVRRSALVRLFRRGLLAEPAVASALRRSSEDPDPAVRQAAFLLAVRTRERLLLALRSRDSELDRQCLELEATAPEPAPVKEPRKSKGKAPAPATETPLDASDLEPLLQASASRALDTSLRGARGLAVLGDPRAFGLLLQLSREHETSARAEVCRAMSALDDARAVERLRSLLHDNEAEVRDAAFSALARIHQAEPLTAAESGLNASHEDVRRRGLETLVALARKSRLDGPGRSLLARALNDQSASVRTEAFKATLSLKVDGGNPGTLRFAGRSLHAEIRREVLNEVMAQVQEPWGPDLLLEFFNDPDPALRLEAFGLAIKKTRGIEFLEAALGSRYADLRMKAVEGLVKKHTAASQALLARALDDEDRTVRLAALESLVVADALPSLALAAGNAHPDVRLRASKALARHGDPRALGPLVALASAPEPEEKERRGDWLALAESALDGLGELGDPAALTHLIVPLDSPHPAIRKQAARALARVSTPDRPDALRSALPHADPEVKYQAALGLACLGDGSVTSLVFSDAAGKVLPAGDQIAAALGLGPAGEDRLIVFLDDPRDPVGSRALLLLMIREWKAPDGTAARCLACLSSRPPRLRMLAAEAIEALGDPAAFAEFVAGLINDRGDKPAWKVPGPTVDALAEMIAHGDPHLRTRTAGLLRHLDADEQAAFDQAWTVHEARFGKELAGLRKEALKRKPTPLKSTTDQLQDLAFGAYVGLVREPAAPRGKGPSPAGNPDPRAARVRQSALGHLLNLAVADPRHARAALPVFIQALGDTNQAVRSQAFEYALALKMPPSVLAAEALASGRVDLGVRGLELLTGEAPEADGRAVLEQAMLARKDGLAIEAAKLLIGRLGPVEVAARALDAAHEPLRLQAVAWLAEESDKDPTALPTLRLALESRYGAVRDAAAFELATKKDPAAFEALVGLLSTADGPKAQRRALQAIESLGDPRGPAALLGRVLDDPAGTALADELIRAAGRFRNPESSGLLFSIAEKDPKRREVAFEALVTVAGHDQPILDREGERPDDRWEREQHPRRDDLLARLVETFSGPGDARFLTRLIPGARWARGKEVDAPLAALIAHPDDRARREAVEALGWRLRKRSGDPEPLRKALGHRDPANQFLAAEGLALAGRPDGLNVLMASLDFAEDLGHRRRAVLALGELADDRAFETLLKLAGEDGHALQESAAEALGHLGRSPRAAEASKLLERKAGGDTGVALSALKGLRWLDTPAGWRIIRGRAAEESCPFRQEALRLLGFNDEPETRDLLLRLLPTLGWSAWWAMVPAQRLWGKDDLEPYYALLQNVASPNIILLRFDQVLSDLRDRGDPSRIFAILPRCNPATREVLGGCLLNRAVLPIEEARNALESPEVSTAALAARVLGRAGTGASGAGPALESALGRWLRAWEAMRSNPSRLVPDEDDEEQAAVAGEPRASITSGLRDLVWAAGRLGVAGETLASMVSARPDDPDYRPIRREAALAMASGGATPVSLGALESAALAGDPEVRGIAAQAIARLDPGRAGRLADRLLTDAVGFRRLTLEGRVRVDETLRAAARLVHSSQGVVLPGLIDRGEVETLASVAEDRALPEAARLGALEGLAAIAREPAEEVLRRVGGDESVDEGLRKAAWRCLRRSRRARSKPSGSRVKP